MSLHNDIKLLTVDSLLRKMADSDLDFESDFIKQPTGSFQNQPPSVDSCQNEPSGLLVF